MNDIGKKKNFRLYKATQSNEIVYTLSLFSFIFRFTKHLLRADILLDTVLGSRETKINETVFGLLEPTIFNLMESHLMVVTIMSYNSNLSQLNLPEGFEKKQ